jgi:Domain of unknown function (DUF1905)
VREVIRGVYVVFLCGGLEIWAKLSGLGETLLRFRGVIQILGINPYVRVTAKIANQLKRNWRKPLPVSVRINECPERPWRINLMPVGDGSFYLYLHQSVRNASGTKVGDRVTVDLSFDGTYRSGPAHPMPEWFRVALEENAIAKKAWNALFRAARKRFFATSLC